MGFDVDVSKKVDKLISLQAAIDALNDEYHGMISDESMKIYQIVEWLNTLPSAQPDLESAYTEGYTAAESKYRKMWDEMQVAQQWNRKIKSKKESKVWRICNAYMTRHMTAQEAMTRIIDIMKEKNFGKK